MQPAAPRAGAGCVPRTAAGGSRRFAGAGGIAPRVAGRRAAALRRAGRRTAADGAAVSSGVADGLPDAAGRPCGLRAVRRCDGAGGSFVLRQRHRHRQHPVHSLRRRWRSSDFELSAGSVPDGGDPPHRLPSGGCQRRAALCGVRAARRRLQAAGRAGGLLPHDHAPRPRPPVAELCAAAAAERRGGAVRRGVLHRPAHGGIPLGAGRPYRRRCPAIPAPDRDAAPVLPVPPAGAQRRGRRRVRRCKSRGPRRAHRPHRRRSVSRRYCDPQRLQGLR